MNKSIPLGEEYAGWELAPMTFSVSNAQVLPPKGIPVEPELPVEGPVDALSTVESASTYIDHAPPRGYVESPFEGLIGVVIGLVLMWVKGRLGLSKR